MRLVRFDIFSKYKVFFEILYMISSHLPFEKKLFGKIQDI